MTRNACWSIYVLRLLSALTVFVQHYKMLCSVCKYKYSLDVNSLILLFQVIILLYLANWMVHLIWRLGDDPDNVAIPYLTAIGDLLGTAFLAIAFHLLFLIGDKDADVGE